ncbi:hypothetical protein SAMN05660199_02774 [Klenkia soli]|uniref:Uncharacterized protein n=1 Tax=Klenkia soli TaxID=1052260 RepID=A0A1H0N8J9_9ACTN|nr:hypothetical protein [Klenkia soli]SDO88785.1 hypothetical protein SAMN05660199_02774 [Klenkia soli]
MKRSLPIAVALVLALIMVALAAFSFSAGQTLTGVLLVVAALSAAYAAVLEIRRRDAAEISQRALADWPPERLRSVVGRIEGDVPRIRAVRKADPRLTLADATALVRGPRA